MEEVMDYFERPKSGVDDFKKLKECGINLSCDLGGEFVQRSKIIKKMESMVIKFYQVVVQHLESWTPPVPKIESSLEQDMGETINN